MKSWKKRLNKEFDAMAPEMSNELRNAPIITGREEHKREEKPAYSGFSSRKAGFWGLAGVAAVLVVVFVSLALAGVFGGADKNETYVFALEINPDVSFVTDSEGTVLGVNSLNADADVVLSDDSTLNAIKGKPLSEAVVAYTDTAARLGYIDLNTAADAVRLSGSEGKEQKLLSGAAENLRGYFKNKGAYVAVAENVVGVSEMGEILGVAGAKQTSDLVCAMQDASLAYGERLAVGVNAEGLKKLHESYIVDSQLYDYISTAILAGIDDFASNARALAEIGILNLKITFSRDNPSAVLTDYWSVTERFDDAYFSDEFRALTDGMKLLLTDYASNFGADITSKDEFYGELYDFAVLAGKEFEDLVFSLASSAIESITDPQAIFEAFEEFAAIDFGKILEDLTPQTILSSLSEYRGILAKSGIDTNLTEALSQAPTTVAEYISEMRSVVNAIYETRTKVFSEGYATAREALTDAEYSAFLDRIAREYGSTENFWKNYVGVQ